jgi:hypothetical protein
MNKKIEIDEPKTRKLIGWEGWNTIMMALFRATAGSDEGFKIADEWCRKNKYKYNEKYTHYTWYVRFRRSPPRSVGAGTLFTIAETEQPGWQKIYDQEHLVKIVETKVKEAIKKKSFIIQRDKSTNKNLRELEEYLLANKVPLYVFGKTLVRPLTTDIEAMQGRMTKTAELFDVEPQYLKVVHWKFPVITGVISTPTLRHDGTILSAAGCGAISKQKGFSS